MKKQLGGYTHTKQKNLKKHNEKGIRKRAIVLKMYQILGTPPSPLHDINQTGNGT
jgi:hypothetical protein